MLAELGGENQEEANDHVRALMAALKKKGSPPSMHLFTDPAQQKKIWKACESGLGATALVPGPKDTWEGREDSAVTPGKTR